MLGFCIGPDRRARVGRLAQLVRALRSHRRGHRFESCAAHYWPVQYLTIPGENSVFFGDCVVSAPCVRRDAIPCNCLHRRVLLVRYVGFCSSVSAALKASCDSVSEVMIAAHEVVLCGHRGRVPRPCCRLVGWIPLDPIGDARRTEILEQPRPRLAAGPKDHLLQRGAEIRPGSPLGCHRHHEQRIGVGAVKGFVQHRPEIGDDRHHAHGVLPAVVLRFRAPCL